MLCLVVARPARLRKPAHTQRERGFSGVGQERPPPPPPHWAGGAPKKATLILLVQVHLMHICSSSELYASATLGCYPGGWDFKFLIVEPHCWEHRGGDGAACIASGGGRGGGGGGGLAHGGKREILVVGHGSGLGLLCVGLYVGCASDVGWGVCTWTTRQADILLYCCLHTSRRLVGLILVANVTAAPTEPCLLLERREPQPRLQNRTRYELDPEPIRGSGYSSASQLWGVSSHKTSRTISAGRWGGLSVKSMGVVSRYDGWVLRMLHPADSVHLPNEEGGASISCSHTCSSNESRLAASASVLFCRNSSRISSMTFARLVEGQC